jgi:transposase-like protein
MPQLQLPVFPVGATEITPQIAVQKREGRVFYVYGHLPVFQHDERDLRSFRMFTSQMIVTGTAKPKDIVRTFGVPRITVKRGVKLYRDRGAEGFFQPAVRKRAGRVLHDEVLKKAGALLSEGQSVPEVARELGVLANTIHKAIRAKRLPRAQKKAG